MSSTRLGAGKAILLALCGLGCPQAAQALVHTFEKGGEILIADGATAESQITAIVPARIASKVAVHLRFLTHARPDDVDIILVGPTGARSMLMSDAGGTMASYRSALIIDQTAGSPLPDDGPLPGSEDVTHFRPANYEPGTPDRIEGPGTLVDAKADLSVFDGLDPTGKWTLYIADDSAGATGVLGGWALEITAPSVVTVNSADDEDDGTCDGRHCSLREALQSLPTQDLVVAFSSMFDTPQTIAVKSPLVVVGPTIIRGPGAHLLTLSGGGKTAVMIATGGPVHVSGMSIVDGMTDSPLAAGGINARNLDMTISDCRLSGHVATNGLSGGAIFSSAVYLTIERSAITDNYAPLGSAVFALASQQVVSLTNSTIADNRGTAIGGFAEMRIDACTMVDNDQALHGANRRLQIANSIITASRLPGPDVNAYDPSQVVSKGHNLIGDRGRVVELGPHRQDIIGVTDPGLAPLAYNGGTTPTHAFASADSLPIDSGASGARPTDQRQQRRPFDVPSRPNAIGGDGADIGAFERRTIRLVTTAADTGDGSCSPTDCSLREAIAAAAAGDEIRFAPVFDTAQTIVLGGSELRLGKDVSIFGPGAHLLKVSGNGNSRVFLVDAGTSVALYGMTITGGNGGLAGGGVVNGGTLTLSGCRVTGNTADHGSGVFNLGTLDVSTSLIDANSGYGGALTNFNGHLNVARSTIANNTATGSPVGAGIDNKSDSFTLRDSTVSGNRATSPDGRNAGGVWSRSGIIRSSTIADNQAQGPGSAGGLRGGFGTVAVRNSIIAANRDNTAVPDVSEVAAGIIDSRGHNLIGNRGAIPFLQRDDQAGDAAAPLDPLLGPLGDYKGPTPTHRLLLNSPAIDRGDDPLPAVDQRGLPRRFGTGMDIGAFQKIRRLVTTTEDTDDGECSFSHCSLREAVAATEIEDVISFERLGARQHTITLNAELVIDQNLTFAGPGAHRLMVRGDGHQRLFRVTPGHTVSLRGMTLRDGRSEGSGGAVLNDGGTLEIADCVIEGNRAAAGGGIANENFGTVTVLRSTVANNLATGSFANGTGGGISTAHRLTVVDSTISGNRVAAGTHNGGGVWSLASVPVVINNSTITANAAAGTGSAGGVRRELIGTLTLRNSIVAGNVDNELLPDVASSDGQGIISGGYNLIGNPGALAFAAAGDLHGDSAAPLDPRLGRLQPNGGTTPTHILRADSPALDTGKAFVSTTDQRGLPRPFDAAHVMPETDGDDSDIGAVEMRPAAVVTNDHSSGPGSLRQVIADAPGDSDIYFDPTFFAVPRTIGPAASLTFVKSLRIHGPGADRLTVAGDDRSPVIAFDNETFCADVTCAQIIRETFFDSTLSDLRITGGRGLAIPEGPRGFRSEGAGGVVYNGNRLVLAGCELTDNTAPYAGGVFGSGSLTVLDSTIANNRATGQPTEAGGDGETILQSGGAIVSSGNLTVVNSTISGNRADGTEGAGGIFTSASTVIRNSTITDNRARGPRTAGGLHHINDGTAELLLRNDIIADNDSLTDVLSDSDIEIVSAGYNLIGYATRLAFVATDLRGAIDPRLGPLQSNGGPTRTHALLADSPALDGGESGGAIADQRRQRRPADDPNRPNPAGGDGADIGAYESQTFLPAPPTPTATTTSGPPTATSTPGGECCAEHNGPGCDLPACQPCMRAIDSYCTTVRWDDECVAKAGDACNPNCLCVPLPTPTDTPMPAVVPTPGGDCCVAHQGAGCSLPACQACVGIGDDFCTTQGWDPVCVTRAGEACNADCGCAATPPATATPTATRTAGGTCCSAHDGGGCDTDSCEACVCDTRPACCAEHWDEDCAKIAAECDVTGAACGCLATETPTTTPTPAGDCCSAQTGPGCGDGACRDCVCDVDAYCCNNTWDGDCVKQAATTCSSSCGCVLPTPTRTPTPGGDCCSSHIGPGCDIPACQACVCGADAPCCSGTGWDSSCVISAATGCDSSCGCASTPTSTAAVGASPTPTASSSPTRTASSSPTPTRLVTPTPPATSGPSASPTRTPVACVGDCNGNGAVAVNEIIVAVNIALGIAAVDACPRFDTDGDRRVAINEVLQGVVNALSGCP
ncbi:MAG: choice-of-anchor Q domain-containing protein [Candidatus Binatia bacterium]